MRIELATLDETDGRFSHTYEPGQLACSDERVQQDDLLTVTGRIAQSKDRIVTRGRIASRAHAECDRCLRVVEVPVSVEFALEYITAEDYEALQAAELSEKDMALSVFDGEAIDVDELVCEQLMLAVPSRVLCAEDCKGLCPICGADRNITECACETEEIDPRWGPLKEIVNRKS